MDFQMEMVCGKPKQTFQKRGQVYTRKGFDIQVTTAEKFHRKCNLMGYTETHVLEMLVEAFNQASGWGSDCKSGSFFEKNPKPHIVESVESVKKGMFPWEINN
jgi:hypothetical protein